MADPLVGYSDLELFLTAWYRAALAARSEPVCVGVTVDNKEPSTGTFPAKLLVIRDDGGPDTSFITAERSVGLSVLAGTKANPKPANDLARIVHALRSQIPAAGYATNLGGVAYRNPVTAVLESSGPLPVTETQDRARRYITLTLGVAAEGL